MKRMISVFLAAFLIFSTPVGALFVMNNQRPLKQNLLNVVELQKVE